jgi:hypothetical protein
MAIHDFKFNQGQEVLQSFVQNPKDPVQEVQKVVDPGDPAAYDSRDEAYYDLRQFGDIDNRTEVNFVEDVRELYAQGFKQFDTHLKNYLSGIRIPVGSGLETNKMVTTMLSGQDKNAIYANRNIVAGRAELPVIAISRLSEEQDFKRFSPPHFEVARNYKNSLKRVELKYRPVPYNLSYTIDIWAEHKKDADFIQYSIQSRFNPIATVYIADDGITMPMEMFFKGSTNNSDLEADAESKSEVMYQISLLVEGWLSLPSKITPTVLARPISIREGIGSNSNMIGGETYEVIRSRPRL